MGKWLPTPEELRQVGDVYLIHLDKPYQHARHYIGWTSIGVNKRFSRHTKGRGSPLLAAAKKAGISFRVVRTWEAVDRYFERKLHNNKNAWRYCQECKKERGYVRNN